MIAVLVVGMITVYAGQYVGQPLYCDRPTMPLTYTETTPPWVALDHSEFESGRVRCGDRIRVYGEGWSLSARAWDAGTLYEYNVEGTPIVADVPVFLAPFPGLSSPGRVVNWTGELRRRIEP